MSLVEWLAESEMTEEKVCANEATLFNLNLFRIAVAQMWHLLATAVFVTWLVVRVVCTCHEAWVSRQDKECCPDAASRD